MSRHVLIIDDETSLTEFLSLLFEQEGYKVRAVNGVAEARECLARFEPELVLCDVMMPDGNGLDLLAEIKEAYPHAAVVMMTAYDSTPTAVEAMKRGAFHYIAKPFDVEELRVLAQKALETTRLEVENVYLRGQLESRYTFSNIIGKSSKMQEIFTLVERIARTTSTVLVQGESGTGKELIARAIHFASPRRAARFMSINCGALPENLLESELFGHERGAFTGAVKEKRGLFQEAHGGALFLDEIGEMTAAMQVKLLRVLQEKTIRKVGGTREESIDVRIIAATHRSLEEMIEEGTFREDLYYRINVIPIRLPPLRERREDIPLLAEHFVQKYRKEMDLPERRITPEAMQRLEGYAWPGNVRELENAIERALALCTEQQVGPSDLPAQLLQRPSSDRRDVELPPEGLDLEALLDGIRERLMGEALDRCSGVQTQAAELLGMSFRSFRYYAKKAGIVVGKDDLDVTRE